jgi:GNAT superfamily N-acetyltransferase
VPDPIDYRLSPPVSNDALNALYAVSWPRHRTCDFTPVLKRSLVYVCASDRDQGDRLIGFVYAAWDGSVHAFLLEPTVHPDYRRRGIGRQLVHHVRDFTRKRGLEWLHVDFDEELQPFYDSCGFTPTPAGLIRLNP